jgi:hypothetical protein
MDNFENENDGKLSPSQGGQHYANYFLGDFHPFFAEKWRFFMKSYVTIHLSKKRLLSQNLPFWKIYKNDNIDPC